MGQLFIAGGNTTKRRGGRSGFTLVELLVVIAIIGVIIALVIPAIQASRESARRSACQNNMRQIGIGLRNFETANRRWPPGRKWSGPRDLPTTFSLSWSSYLLSYIEEQTIDDAINYSLSFTDPVNLPYTSQVVSIYMCPSTSRIEDHRTEDGHLINLGSKPGEGLGCIDYLGVSGPDKDAKHPITKEFYGRQRGVLIGTKGLPDGSKLIEPPPITSAKIVDGLSYTMCVTECTGRGVDVKNGEIDSLNGAWASGSNVTHIDKGVNDVKPPDAWYNERIFSDHTAGALALMCDASVQFLSDDTEKTVLRSLCSRDGGEDLEGAF